MKFIYGIKEIEQKGEKKEFWTKIGVVYENGKQILDYVPVNSSIRIIIKENEHES